MVAAAGVPVVLMHHQGAPETMQDDPRYDDVLVEVYLWLEERIAAAEAAGIERVADPRRSGLRLRQERRPQPRADERPGAVPCARLPDVLGASRKRTIGALSNEAPADQRLGGSLALALKAAEQGAQIIRVHDVFETVRRCRSGAGFATRR